MLASFLLAGIATLQIAGILQAHEHGHGNAGTHSCAVCHANHLPAVEAAGGFSLNHPPVPAWRSWCDEASALQDYRPALQNSRAPPA